MYASFIETTDKSYLLVAPSKSRAAAREAGIKIITIELGHRVKSRAYCEFLFDEADVQHFISTYGTEGIEVERIGF